MVEIKKHTMHCPVCMMKTDAESIHFRYQRLKFTFCSEQCKERFTKNPNLYAALVGKPTIKYSVKKIIKHRILNLDNAIPKNAAREIYHVLPTMMGVKDIDVSNNKINITYDLLEVTTEQIEERIEKIGAYLSKNWFNRLKRACIHYKEGTELANLEQDNGYSCHNPPK